MLGQLFGVVVSGLVGYEVLKKYKAMRATTAMMQGHLYSLALNYTKDPSSPVTQAQVQAQLDAVEPGGFNVLSAAMTPGPQSGIRQMALSVERVGVTKDVPNSTFTTGWPPEYGTVSIDTSSDMGGPQSTIASLGL